MDFLIKILRHLNVDFCKYFEAFKRGYLKKKYFEALNVDFLKKYFEDPKSGFLKKKYFETLKRGYFTKIFRGP